MITKIAVFLFFAGLSVIFVYSGIRGVSGKAKNDSIVRQIIFYKFFTKFGIKAAGTLFIIFGLVLGIVALRIITLLI